jgi:hypothetical protein
MNDNRVPQHMQADLLVVAAVLRAGLGRQRPHLPREVPPSRCHHQTVSFDRPYVSCQAPNDMSDSGETKTASICPRHKPRCSGQESLVEILHRNHLRVVSRRDRNVGFYPLLHVNMCTKSRFFFFELGYHA